MTFAPVVGEQHGSRRNAALFLVCCGAVLAVTLLLSPRSFVSGGGASGAGPQGACSILLDYVHRNWNTTVGGGGSSSSALGTLRGGSSEGGAVSTGQQLGPAGGGVAQPAGGLIGGGSSKAPPEYVAAVLDSIAAWQPRLPPRAVQRGLYSLGEPARMRRFVHKLLSGKPVSVGSVGGSVTAGQGAVHGGTFMAALHDWVRKVSPSAEHDLRNGAFGGSTSGLFAVCTNTAVQQGADLVIVEFAVNDHVVGGDLGENLMNAPERRAFERMLRKLLDLPNRPAVVLLNWYSWFASKPRHPNEINQENGQFHRSAENDFNVLGQYYALPTLSVRAAVYRFMLEGRPGYKVDLWKHEHPEANDSEVFYYDPVHPVDAKYGSGHGVLSDLVISLIKETALGLLRQPLSGEDEHMAQEPLQPPMLEGNFQSQSAGCQLHRDFEKVVVEQRGFEWRNERPQAATTRGEKWGWIATAPGSWALLRVDTRMDGGGHSREAGSGSVNNTLMLAYLKSYKAMGRAAVECVANCRCERAEIDGQWEREASLTNILPMAVTPHERCEVKVTVLDASSSTEGHKVKISGVMVAGGVQDLDGPWFGTQVEMLGNPAKPGDS